MRSWGASCCLCWSKDSQMHQIKSGNTTGCHIAHRGVDDMKQHIMPGGVGVLLPHEGFRSLRHAIIQSTGKGVCCGHVPPSEPVPAALGGWFYQTTSICWRLHPQYLPDLT